MSKPIILASASPRRKEILDLMGLKYTIVAAKGEEIASGTATKVVKQLAKQKAKEVALQYADHFVIGADTVVCLDGKIMGKPADAKEAFAMLRALSGKKHQVYTGVCIYSPTDRSFLVDHDCTDVYFAELSDVEIQNYIASGEPFDKAGAYALQGIAGACVTKIEGCVSNVIGLPMPLLKQMLMRCGAITAWLQQE
ncbi:MAG: Maf family protein [Eubacteriales bacterium]|nr:Maf family protein [Eubacteriales bacterium]